MSYGTILTLSNLAVEEKKREGKGRKTIELSPQKNLKRFMKGKLERERNACPTHLVLRQEDGAVRPEKKIALETQSRVVTKRNAKDTRNERIARPEEKVALDTLEKEDRAVRPEENTALLCRNETKREPNAKRKNCPPRRRGYFGYLSKRRQSCPPRRKYSPAVPAIFGISEETPCSRLRPADI